MVGIRRSGRQVTCPALLLALLVALVGCSPSPPLPSRAPVSSSPRPALPTVPTRPLPTVVLAPTRSPRATPTWLPTATPTRLPTATSSPTPVPVCYFDPEGTITSTEPLRGVIIFIKYTPIPERGVSRPQLWAVSSDGRRIGQLTADGEGVGFYAPPVPPPDLILLSTASFSPESERVRFVRLPPECDEPAKRDPRVSWYPCSDFQFSLDGRRVGFFWGGGGCGREGLMVIDLLSGEIWRRNAWHWAGREVHWFHFLSSGRMLVADGHCEGGEIWLWDLQTGEERELGIEGDVYWNANGTALAVIAGYYGGWQTWIWIYDVAADRLITPAGMSVEWPIWTPDGTGLLYYNSEFVYTKYITFSAGYSVPVSATVGPHLIYAVDIATAEVRVLAGNPQYDYFVGRSTQDCRWQGDWLMLRRIGFQTREYPVDDWGLPQVPYSPCLEWSGDCPSPVEILALNWRTGEIVPWEQVPHPTPAPTFTPLSAMSPTPVPTAGPALFPAPLYTDPAGRYALYVGTGGTGLWCVPAGGAPVRWIAEGYHFIYIP